VLVLVPDPKVVRRLLTRYATLRIAQAERESLAAARELEDVSHTLCVMMGSVSIRDALAKADALLEAAGRRAVTTTTDPDGETGLQLAV
jgi:hypothetical protein